MGKLFYHGMQPRRTTLCKIRKMLEIIDSGGLKSNRLLDNNLAHGYNGLDYISVCSREKFYKYFKKEESAFNIFIKNNFCFILSNEIGAIKTVYLDYDKIKDYNDLVEYKNLFPNQQFSDLFDEWQVKDEIPLSYILGIGLPFKNLSKMKVWDYETLEGIKQLYLFAKLFNWDIVDSSTVISFYNYEKLKTKSKSK